MRRLNGLHSTRIEVSSFVAKGSASLGVSFIGAGGHTRVALAPAFKKAGAAE